MKDKYIKPTYDFYNEAILCPNCEYGIIHKYYPNVDIFEYADGTTRMGITIFMECPYCGDTVLTMDKGCNLTYNYVEEHWTGHVDLKFTKVTRIDFKG